MQLRLMRSRLRTSEIAIMGIGVVLAAFLGIVSFSRGGQVFVVLFAALGAFVVLLEPLLGMLVVAFTIPLQNVVTFGSGLTAIKVLGAFVFGTWLLRKLYRRELWSSIFSTHFFKVSLIFLAVAVVSMVWAQYYSDAYVPLFQLVQLFLWSMLIIDLGDTWDRVEWLIKSLLVGALIASVLVIREYYLLDVARAGDSAAGINTTAGILVTVVPFAFYLIRTTQNELWRLLGLSYLLSAFLAVVLTFSRMSIIALPLVILAQYWETLKGQTGRRWLIVVIVGLVLAANIIPKDLLEERVQTIRPELQAVIEGGDPRSGRGARGVHLSAGLAMFRDHPALGVGYGNYGAHFLYEYQFRNVGASKVWTTKRSPHSSHIGLLAELGIIGFVVWAAILGFTLRNLVTSWSMCSKGGSTKQLFLVQAVTYSFLVQILAYGWYENIHQEKLFWSLLAIGVAIRRLSKQRTKRDSVSRERGELEFHSA